MNPIGWQVVKDEFYVRDVSGKEIAIYDATNSTNLHQWNVYGLDNVGYIKSDGTKYFYLKDHLSSVRCVIDESNNVVSAQDYDSWGYLLENRSYESSLTKYKFTGKERDNESMYDYFGARYYDSRIGRWGGVEPLYDKYISISPYIYSLSNPIRFVDPEGKQVDAIEFLLKYPEVIIPLVPEAVAKAGTVLIVGGIIILVTPNELGRFDVKESIFIPGREGYLEYPYPITEDVVITSSKSESQPIDKSKTAEELISATGKRSKSYHEELSKRTYEEIKEIAKDINDPLRQAAKQMKKLIEQSRGRLKEKKDQEGKY